MIEQVDGQGSGLDADTIRGLTPEQLAGAASDVAGLRAEVAALRTENRRLEARLAVIQSSQAPARRSPIATGDSLENLLASASLSPDGTVLRFSEINVQVVSGTGSTYGLPNGRGNLIIGYNESRGACDQFSGPSCDYPLGSECSEADAFCYDLRGRSHNLIIGAENNYSGQGALIVGTLNSTGTGRHSVTIGRLNDAPAQYCSIVGGDQNSCRASDSVIAGGYANVMDKGRFFIGGGEELRATTMAP